MKYRLVTDGEKIAVQKATILGWRFMWRNKNTGEPEDPPYTSYGSYKTKLFISKLEAIKWVEELYGKKAERQINWTAI